MICPYCNSALVESQEIEHVGLHVICYVCNAEWVE